MKKKIIFIIIAMLLLMPIAKAESMKATDYIQKIANDAGGNTNSTEVIGNTSLAYDGTVDNNLRYVGLNPNNYIKFNDELWRIIGVMNNVEDENGNKAPKLKIIRYESIGSYPYDVTNYNVNNSAGINEWSRSTLNRLLNPGFETYIDEFDYSTQLANNSLYYNRNSGKCGRGANCDFTNTGLKESSKQLISKVIWNTGTILVHSPDGPRYSYIYEEERSTAEKCTFNANNYYAKNYCNDTVTRTNKYLGKVGLMYASDYLYSITGDESISKEQCISKKLNEWGYISYEICPRSSWMFLNFRRSFTITPSYSPVHGIYSLIIDTQGELKDETTSSQNNTYPAVYLNNSTKIIDGSGTYKDPYIIANSNYEDEIIENNTTANGEYKGDYSIDSLINKYNIITFGTQNNNLETAFKQKMENTEKGDLKDIKTIEGPVLVNGNYTLDNNSGTFATKNKNDESFIKGELGNNIKTSSKVITNQDYIDFEEMYVQVVNEQALLVEKTEKHINKETIQVNEPGIYMINNTTLEYDIVSETFVPENRKFIAKKIYIDNYDANNNYVFNIMNLFVDHNYEVYIKSSGESSFTRFNDFVETGKYTGNIIFNYPNARYINLSFVSGKIIAPKADIFLEPYTESNIETVVNDSIFANSIKGTKVTNIKFNPKKNNKKIIDEPIEKNYLVTPTDNNDDLYTGDYSIKELLENYNIVTFGKNNYGENSIYNKIEGFKQGNASLFHIDGQFLINGTFLNIKIMENGQYQTKENRIDLDSNKITESYSKDGGVFYIKYWTQIRDKGIFGSKNKLYANNLKNQSNNIIPNFINFDRLYENVISEQSKIDQGKKVIVEDGIIHIKIGGNYYIEDINEIKEIIFDNYDDNKNKLTIITIKNNENINFPKISGDTEKYITTNDYYSKSEATYEYELNSFKEDTYHGNIVWNVPNATYIKLAENAPFAGHLIAPNADVESPELHFAGCFIVNSIYGEGNIEAHFYPLSNLPCYSSDYNSLSEIKKMKFNDYRLRKALGEENTTIEKEILGNNDEYNKDIELFDSIIPKCENREIIINPKTTGTIGVLLAIIAISFTTLTLKTKKKA